MAGTVPGVEDEDACREDKSVSDMFAITGDCNCGG